MRISTLRTNCCLLSVHLFSSSSKVYHTLTCVHISLPFQMPEEDDIDLSDFDMDDDDEDVEKKDEL